MVESMLASSHELVAFETVSVSEPRGNPKKFTKIGIPAMAQWWGASPRSGVQFRRSKELWGVRCDEKERNQMEWYFFNRTKLPSLYNNPKMGIDAWRSPQVLPHLYRGERPNTCTIGPLDIVYVPEDWHYAWATGENLQSHAVLLATLEGLMPRQMSTMSRDKAKQHRRQGNLNGAVDRLEMILKEFPGDLGSLVDLGRVGKLLGVESMEMRYRKAVLSATSNRTCDGLHAFGRMQLRQENTLAAKQIAYQCMRICDWYSKCADLLASAIQKLHGGKASQHPVVVESRAIAARNRKGLKKTVTISGYRVEL